MDLFEYIWLTSFQITKKNHEEIKILLRDDIRYPALGKDKHNYAICFAKPKRIDDDLVSYLGLFFDINNDTHKRFLWQTFKASVFHLSMHVAVSNFEVYAEWSKKKNLDLATYAASIIEDAAVRACLKTMWTPFIHDVALANTLSFLKTKPLHLISNPTLRLMVAGISHFSMGTLRGQVSDRLKNDVNNIIANLISLEGKIQGELFKKTKTEQKEDLSKKITDSVLKEKIAIADIIYHTLKAYGETTEAPSLLYSENHGNASIFYGNDVPPDFEVKENINSALNILKEGTKEHEATDSVTVKSLDDEISQVFSAWQSKEATEKKILESYRLLGSKLRFRSFEFAKEDFSEYVRGKALLSSPIRRIMERLRLYKNQTGEDYRHEMGNLDMQEAIQVIASKSQRTDVFVRDELQTREDAWAILIDASHSLRFFTGEVRGIALCLSEVARKLFTNQNSWSEFAFNDKFYVIKDFSEAYTNRTRARIGGLEHGGMSYIPDALLLAAQSLKRQTEEMKLLVVVSDFFPSGYEDAEDTLADCVKKVQKTGIGIIGIGVKSKAVKRYFRINCVVEDPYELMKKFVEAFFEFSSTA